MGLIAAAIMQELRTSLQLRQQELQAQLRQRLHQADELEQLALFNNYTIEADQAEASQLSDIDMALLQHELAELRAVDDALARLDRHSYGKCSDCGDTIAVARLRAQPSAHLCHACQAAAEGANSSGAAPVHDQSCV